MTEKETIYDRLNHVREEVDYIKKDTRVDGKYSAVTHDEVTARVRPSLVKHKVFIIPSLMQETMVDAGETRSGIKKWRYEAVFKIKVAAAGADGEVEMVIPAHADDFGDKAPGKALSYAVKSAMLKLFSLETGENDESRVEAEQPKTVNKDQVERMKALAKLAGHDDDYLLNFIQTKIPMCKGVESLETLPIGPYAKVIAVMERNLAKKEKTDATGQ